MPMFSRRRRFACLALVLPAVLAGCSAPKSPGASGGAGGRSSSAPTAAAVQVSEKNAGILGRATFRDGALLLEWTNSGVLLRFQGTGVRAALSGGESDPNLYPALSVQVDGGREKRLDIKENGTVTLAGALSAGAHTLRLVKVTEPTSHPLALGSLTLLTDGSIRPRLLAPPALPARRMEFIGDSLTCGFGNLGTSADSRFATAQEDGLQTFASFTAAAFGADARYICMSGRGIVRNADGGSGLLIPELFGRVSPTLPGVWDFSRWQPDVVVVNAGSNDVSGKADMGAIADGVTAFLGQVRKSYPRTQIIWCYGLVNRGLGDTLSACVTRFNAKDGHAVYLPLSGLAAGEEGAAGHPNVKAHKARAAVLIREVEKLTGWTAAA